jgi:hypothetical protein
MSVTLTSYPVTTESGKVKNIFAGFDAVEVEFDRQDASIVSVTQGADNQILISIATDITGSLNVGEWVYLYAAGSTFTYDNVYQITDLTYSAPNTEITVDGDYIETASIGYCNYKQNWYLESKIVNPDNNDVKVYPELLQNDGNPNGEVKVNVSMVVDFLKNEFLEQSGEVTNARKQLKLMTRESWREDDTDTFALVAGESIVVIFAAENAEIETFVTGFDVPKMWAGYPFFVNMLHSLENHVGERVSVEFDELDINTDEITTGNLLFDFSGSAYGILQTNFSDNQKDIEDNTRYIRLNAFTSGLGDFKAGDFKAGDFNV